jgi:hypothetical protein
VWYIVFHRWWRQIKKLLKKIKIQEEKSCNYFLHSYFNFRHFNLKLVRRFFWRETYFVPEDLKSSRRNRIISILKCRVAVRKNGSNCFPGSPPPPTRPLKSFQWYWSRNTIYLRNADAVWTVFLLWTDNRYIIRLLIYFTRNMSEIQHAPRWNKR